MLKEKTGRPVRIVSISFNNHQMDEIATLVDEEAGKGTDIIALPETWRGVGDIREGVDSPPETLDGPTITTFASLAKSHGTYIVCPLFRKDDSRKRINSSVLIDRQGEVVCVYDKVYPYWSEFDLDPPVEIGMEAPVVYEADFGRIGMAICFDVNFPEVWRRLADQGAELVVWSSAYSAGTSLQAHAINNHFYIVSSSLTNDCIVYDITGKEILYEKSEDINVSRITLDLDRGIYHTNFNMEKRDKLLKEHGESISEEIFMERELWFVLKADKPNVSARELAHRYGLEELRDYLNRSRREIDRMRGWKFAEKINNDN